MATTLSSSDESNTQTLEHEYEHECDHTSNGTAKVLAPAPVPEPAAPSLPLPRLANDPLSILRKSISLSACIITPHDTLEYDIERWTYALNYCHSPSLIIVCASTSDVVQALKYCRSTGQDFTVAGGMYCSVLYCQCIDLTSHM